MKIKNAMIVAVIIQSYHALDVITMVVLCSVSSVRIVWVLVIQEHPVIIALILIVSSAKRISNVRYVRMDTY